MGVLRHAGQAVAMDEVEELEELVRQWGAEGSQLIMLVCAQRTTRAGDLLVFLTSLCHALYGELHPGKAGA